MIEIYSKICEILRFGIVGVIATGLHYGLYYLLNFVMNVNVAYIHDKLRGCMVLQFLFNSTFYISKQNFHEARCWFCIKSWHQLFAAYVAAKLVPMVGTVRDMGTCAGVLHSDTN